MVPLDTTRFVSEGRAAINIIERKGIEMTKQELTSRIAGE